MNRSEFATALRSAGEIARDRDFFVLGSQAILGLVSRPPKSCLTSMELDIYPRHNLQSVQLLVTKLGNRSAFSKRNGFFIDCVSPEIATLPERWVERLVPFRTKRTGGVTGWCLEIYDLAVSKLAAGRAKDMKYVAALLKGKYIRPGVLKRRIAHTPVSSDNQTEMLSRFERLL
jgi:hypothetical protein